MFVIEGKNKDECRDMMEKYLQTIKSPRKEITEGRYTLSDPHHGAIDLHWKGRNISGIIGNVTQFLKSKYFEKFVGRLEENP